MFTLLSLICSAFAELVAQAFKLRAKNLETAIKSLLVDKNVHDAFYRHPLITSLVRPASSAVMPSYIPGSTFASVLVQIVARDSALEGNKQTAQDEQLEQDHFDYEAEVTVETLREKIRTLEDKELRRVLLAMLDDAAHDMKDVREAITEWFENTMDRAQGWYKRYAHKLLLLIAAIVVCITNADTLAVGGALWRDPALRAIIVTEANATVAARPSELRETSANHRRPALDATPAPASDQADPLLADITSAAARVDERADSLRKLKELGLPLGWGAANVPATTNDWILKIAGLLISILAASQGAPFWFELLNKVVNLRGTGKRPAPPESTRVTKRRELEVEVETA
jgi:hypothetical protein